MYYAGIGSRDVPDEILKIMYMIAKHLGNSGVTLRSGGASGADSAFEAGCDASNGKKEIYLPWRKFQNSTSNLVVNNPRAFEIAKEFHPAPDNLSQGALKLQARNSHQVLGADLESPSDFIVCYTKGGKGSGGTGQALRIAKHYNIPIFDCGSFENDLENLKEEYRKFIRALDKNKK